MNTRIRTILFVAWMSVFTAAHAEEVVAIVNGESITDRDVAEFGKRSPQFAPYLSAPGGPMRLLRLMIDDRLLLLEGERQKIPRPSEGSSTLYLMKLQDELVESCPEPSDEIIEQFYNTERDLFSTPLYLRLRRIGLMIDPTDLQPVIDRLTAIKHAIDAGDKDFGAVADEISEDIIGQGRGGDIGYRPIDVQHNPMLSIFVEAEAGETIGPVFEETLAFLYQVTGRRDPILEPLDAIRDEVARHYARTCRARNLDRLIERLEARWPVEILVDDIDIRPRKPG